MTIYYLEDIGTIEITNKLKAKFNISADQLFSKYPDLSLKLSKDARNIIIEAVNKKGNPKLKKAEKEIKAYFEAIQDKQSQMGFAQEEAKEKVEAEELKKEDISESELDKILPSQPTFDKATGEQEGVITTMEDTESKLVPIIINEKYEAFLTFDGEPTEKEPSLSGLLKIENVSQNDRLWDLDLELKNIKETTLESNKVKLKELVPTEKYEAEYKITKSIRPNLELKEFITSAKGSEEPVYALRLNEENTIYEKIHLSNSLDSKLLNIELKKLINPGFEDIEIQSQTIGEAEIIEENGNKYVLWKIDEFPAEGDADLEFETKITTSSKEEVIRSGPITISYTLNNSLSGIEIASFDSYTNNAFNIITSELEDKPHTYDCQVVLENKSDFAIRLVNVDVYRPDNVENKFLDIDPSEIPPIPAKGKWTSKNWTYKVEKGKYPKFKTKFEFFTLADHQVTSQIQLNYADTELAVAALEAQLLTDVTQIPSYQISPVKFTAKIKNIGGALINSIKLVDNLPTSFLPGNRESIEISLNNNELAFQPGIIKIEPDNQDPAVDHIMTINIDDIERLAKSEMNSGDELIIKYDISAHEPAKEMTFTSNIELSANTRPQSSEIAIDVEQVEIAVLHVRHSLSKGKDIQALEKEGEFEVTLTVQNMAETDLIDYELTDGVPKDQVVWDITDNPEIIEEMNEKKLKWKLESIAPGNSKSVKYKIKPAGETSITEIEKTET